MKGRERADAWFQLTVLVVAFAAVVLFLIEVEGCVVDPPSTARHHWNFWIQMLTGSSWPNFEPLLLKHCIAFSLAAAVHSMLNIAAGLGIVWLILQMLRDRRRSMELARLIALRDCSLKAQVENLLQALPDDQFEEQADRIDKVFRDANKHLERSLAVLVGDAEAKRVIEALGQNEI